MIELTFHVRLIGSYENGLGYIDYVFENLGMKDPETSYIACTQFPNWNQSPIKLGDVGYVTVKQVIAGEDTWFDGKHLNFYNYDMVIFLKFRPEQLIVKEEIILD